MPFRGINPLRGLLRRDDDEEERSPLGAVEPSSYFDRAIQSQRQLDEENRERFAAEQRAREERWAPAEAESTNALRSQAQHLESTEQPRNPLSELRHRIPSGFGVGLDLTGQSMAINADVARGADPETLARTIAENNQRESGVSPDVQGIQERIQQVSHPYQGAWGEGEYLRSMRGLFKTLKSTASEFAHDPVSFAEFSAQALGTSVVPIGAMIAGGLIGNVRGAIAGGFAGSASLEFGLWMQERVTEEATEMGLDPRNPTDIATVLNDPDVRAHIMRESAEKGLSHAAIGAVMDRLSAGLLSSSARAASRRAVANEALSTGPDAGARVAAGTMQVASEGLEEMGSQIIATGDYDVADVALEVAGGLGAGVSQTIVLDLAVGAKNKIDRGNLTAEQWSVLQELGSRIQNGEFDPQAADVAVRRLLDPNTYDPALTASQNLEVVERDIARVQQATEDARRHGLPQVAIDQIVEMHSGDPDPAGSVEAALQAAMDERADPATDLEALVGDALAGGAAPTQVLEALEVAGEDRAAATAAVRALLSPEEAAPAVEATADMEGREMDVLAALRAGEEVSAADAQWAVESGYAVPTASGARLLPRGRRALASTARQVVDAVETAEIELGEELDGAEPSMASRREQFPRLTAVLAEHDGDFAAAAQSLGTTEEWLRKTLDGEEEQRTGPIATTQGDVDALPQTTEQTRRLDELTGELRAVTDEWREAYREQGYQPGERTRALVQRQSEIQQEMATLMSSSEADSVETTPVDSTAVDTTAQPDEDAPMRQARAVDAPQTGPWYYSALQRAVETSAQNSAPAKQWIATLKKTPGIKAEEIEWSGLEEWLGDRDKVSREEIVQYLEQNGVQVEERFVGQGSGFENEMESIRNQFMQYGLEISADMDGEISFEVALGVDEKLRYDDDGEVRRWPGYVSETDDVDMLAEYIAERLGATPEDALKDAGSLMELAHRYGELHDSDSTSGVYEQYMLPGGKNPRALVLKLPAPAWHSEGRRDSPSQAAEAKVFRSHAFDDPNILAWVRFNERTDADGKRVLLIEEIQSDWHQEGRKRGYAGRVKDRYEIRTGPNHEGKPGFWIADLENQRNIVSHWYPTRERAEEAMRDLEAGAGNVAGKPVPDAPFKRTWHELALKRMIRYAAENGFDRIAWTTGDQQNERYSLERHVDFISVDEKQDDGSRYIYVTFKEGGRTVSMAVDGVGTVIDSSESRLEGSQLSEVVGEQLAEKIMTFTPRGSAHADTIISGEDLKMGGHGMRGFYDKLLPAAANKLGKKYGVKASTTRINATDTLGEIGEGSLAVVRSNGEVIALTDYDSQAHEIAREHSGATVIPASEANLERGTAVHSLDLPMEMVEDVLGGQPLFSRRSDPSQAASHYYSALKRAVEQSQQRSASGQQWLATLTKMPGIKQEEIEWIGLKDFLADRPKVTREEIVRFIDVNGVQIIETNLGGEEGGSVGSDLEAIRNKMMQFELEVDYDEADEVVSALTREGYSLGTVDEFVGYLRERDPLMSEEQARATADDLVDALADYFHLYESQRENIDSAQYEDYQLPGGKNYTEILFQFPLDSELIEAYNRQRDALGDVLKALPDRPRFSGWDLVDKNSEARAEVRKALGNARADELLLALDEATEEARSIQAEPRSGDMESDHFPGMDNVFAHARFNERDSADGTPMLFIEEIQSDWHQSGRDDGYKGEGLGRYEIVQSTIGEGSINPKAGFGLRDKVRGITLPQWYPTRDDAEERARERGVPLAPFSKTWHKLVLRRMIREAAQRGFTRIGWTTGETQNNRWKLTNKSGMTGFYDKMVVVAANEIGKPYGAKAGRSTVAAGEESVYGGDPDAGALRTVGLSADKRQVYVEVHTLDLTPQMIEDALGGIPMFQRSQATKQAYEDRIDALMEGLPSAFTSETMNERPAVMELLGHANEKQRPMRFAEGKVKASNEEHGVTANDWKNVAEWVERPLAVFQSEQDASRLVFISPTPLESGDLARIIVQPAPTSFDKSAHVVVSVHPLRPGYEARMARWAKDGLLRYVDTKTAAEVGGAFQSQLTGMSSNPRGLGAHNVKTQGSLVKLQRKIAEESAASDGPMFSRRDPGAQQEARELIVQYSVTAEKLRHAQRMGGFAVPSLAITKVGSPITGFGDITLIGPRNMADPRGDARTRVFGADIYSPRYPTVTFKLNPKARAALAEKLGVDEYTRDADFDTLANYDPFKEWVRKEHGEASLNSYHALKEHAENLLREVGADEVMFRGFTNLGYRRYQPHTLDNVVKILKKDLRGGEGFNYGVGSLRAHFTPQFRSLKQIRDNRDLLVDHDAFEKIKTEIDEEFFEIAEKLSASSDSGEYFLGFADTVIAVMEDSAKMGVPRALDGYGFEDVSEELQKEIAEFLTKLRTLPTEYFEAKILRAVDLSEFRAAVVPEGVAADIVTLLKSSGVDVVTYKSGDNADRARATAEAAGRHEDVLFQRREQDAQTETPEFKAWFKGSVVVNEDGSPMVMYHGTQKEFDEFRTDQRSDGGAHFGTQAQANQVSGEPNRFAATGPNVMPVYLSIKNPLRLEDHGYFRPQEIAPQLASMGMLDEAEAARIVAIDKLPFGADRDARYDSAVQLMREIITSAGHDGIVYLNRREGSHDPFGPDGVEGAVLNGMSDAEVAETFPDAEDSYIAFSPTQIKSAIGNDGSFNPNDPNILRSANEVEAATTDHKTFHRWHGEGVVDENGKPLIVYIGAVGDEVIPFGDALVATSDPSVAGTLALNAGIEEALAIDTDPSSPFGSARAKAMRAPRAQELMTKIPAASGKEKAAAIRELNEIVAASMQVPGDRKPLPVFMSLKNSVTVDAEGQPASAFPLTEQIAKAREAGHDGLIVRNVTANNLPTDYFVAFNHDQVKQAAKPMHPKRRMELTNAGKGLPVEQVKQVLRQIEMNMGTMPTVIVEAVENLPARLYLAIKAGGKEALEGTNGLYDPNTRTAYVIANNVRDVHEAVQAIVHETVGHKGLRSMLGAEEYANYMDRIIKTFPQTTIRTAERNGLSDQKRGRPWSSLSLEYKRKAAEEVFAYAVQNMIDGTGEFTAKQKNLLQDIIARIRYILGRLMPKRAAKWKITDADVIELARRVSEHVRSGRFKEAMENSPVMRMVRETSSEHPFFSQMVEVLDAKLPEVGRIDQIIKQIENMHDFKKDELKWSGLIEWLGGVVHEMTPADLLQELGMNSGFGASAFLTDEQRALYEGDVDGPTRPDNLPSREKAMQKITKAAIMRYLELNSSTIEIRSGAEAMVGDNDAASETIANAMFGGVDTALEGEGEVVPEDQAYLDERADEMIEEYADSALNADSSDEFEISDLLDPYWVHDEDTVESLADTLVDALDELARAVEDENAVDIQEWTLMRDKAREALREELHEQAVANLEQQNADSGIRKYTVTFELDHDVPEARNDEYEAELMVSREQDYIAYKLPNEAEWKSPPDRYSPASGRLNFEGRLDWVNDRMREEAMDYFIETYADTLAGENMPYARTGWVADGALEPAAEYREHVYTINPDPDRYESTAHYDGIGGYVAHGRFSNRATSDLGIGKRNVIFVEEVQSDRAQEFREEVMRQAEKVADSLGGQSYKQALMRGDHEAAGKILATAKQLAETQAEELQERANKIVTTLMAQWQSDPLTQRYIEAMNALARKAAEIAVKRDSNQDGVLREMANNIETPNISAADIQAGGYGGDVAALTKTVADLMRGAGLEPDMHTVNHAIARELGYVSEAWRMQGGVGMNGHVVDFNAMMQVLRDHHDRASDTDAALLAHAATRAGHMDPTIFHTYGPFGASFAGLANSEDALELHVIRAEYQAARKTLAAPDTFQYDPPPMQDSWPLMVIKHAIRQAAEQGMDSVIWADGTMHAIRWSGGEWVRNIQVTRREDKKGVPQYSVTTVDSGGAEVGGTLAGFENAVGAVPAAYFGRYVGAGQGRALAAKVKDLEVGQAINIPAQHLQDQKASGSELSPLRDSTLLNRSHYQEAVYLSNERGAGLRAFYDEMLPQQVNKFLKPYKIRVEYMPVNIQGTFVQQMGFVPTAEMEASAMDGLPMWSRNDGTVDEPAALMPPSGQTGEVIDPPTTNTAEVAMSQFPNGYDPSGEVLPGMLTDSLWSWRRTFESASDLLRRMGGSPLSRDAGGRTLQQIKASEEIAEKLVKGEAISEEALAEMVSAMEPVAHMIDLVFDREQRNTGRFNAIMARAVRMADSRDKARFAEWAEAWDQNDTEQAKRIYDSASLTGKELIDAWRAAAEMTGRENQRVGVQVFDTKLGKMRPIGMAPRFYPRVLQKWAQDGMFAPTRNPKEWARVVQVLIDSGKVANEEEAKEFIRANGPAPSMTRNDYFSGIEKARTDGFPPEMYDYTLDTALDYGKRWSERLAQIETLGQEGTEMGEVLLKIESNIHDPKLKDYVHRIRSRIYNEAATDPIGRLIASTNMLATGVQLGNYRTAAQNFVTGSGLNYVSTGLIDSLRSQWKAMKLDADEVTDAEIIGVLRDDILSVQRDLAESANVALSEFTGFTMKWGAYTVTERQIRLHALLGGKIMVRRFINEVGANPFSGKSKRLIAWMQRNGFDYEKVLAENGKGEYTNRVLRYIVNLPQGSYKINMTPVLADEALGRVAFKYRKYGTQVERLKWRNHFEPFIKTITGGERIQVRDPVSGELVDQRAYEFVAMLRLLMLPAIYGYANKWVRWTVFGSMAALAGPDWEDIEDALENAERAKAAALALQMAWESLIMSGIMGNFQTPVQLGRDFSEQKSIANPLDPPAMGFPKAVFDLVRTAYHQGRITARDIDFFLVRSFSLYNATFGSRPVRYLMAEMGGLDRPRLEEFRLARASVGKEMRRYLKEMDLPSARSRGGGFAPTPQTPINREISAAIILGRPEQARAILTEYLDTLEGDENVPWQDRVRAAVTSARTHVRNQQPTALAGHFSARQRREFLSWADQNLPPEKAARIRALDETYRRNAVDARLMPPEDMRRARREDARRGAMLDRGDTGSERQRLYRQLGIGQFGDDWNDYEGEDYEDDQSSLDLGTDRDGAIDILRQQGNIQTASLIAAMPRRLSPRTQDALRQALEERG